MRKLVITTSFDNHNHPLRSCIYIPGGKSEIIPMYAPGTGYTRYHVKHIQMQLIHELFTGSTTGKYQIITHNFKRHLQVFNLSLDQALNYDVYDIPDFRDVADDRLEVVARELAGVELYEYQRIRANSAVAYQEMERAGLKHNGVLRYPIWNQYVVTGRTSCSGFNIQGIPRHDQVAHIIHHPADSEDYLLLHFDWIAADICMAAQLSGDSLLSESFVVSDPYQLLVELLDRPRDQCKRELLSGIHGLHLQSDVFKVYERLREWILECKMMIGDPDTCLSTILGRKFRVGALDDRQKVVSYIVQGSTAHAMQSAIRRMWELWPAVRVLADVHDSLVISCAAANFERVIRDTQCIMSNPFGDILDISMPYRVGMCRVSKGWNNWRPVLECRNGRLKKIFNATARHATTEEVAPHAAAAETGPAAAAGEQ